MLSASYVPSFETATEWRREVVTAIHAGELGGARRTFDSAAVAWRKSPTARRVEARLLLAEGSAERAEALCREVLALHPSDAEMAWIRVEALCKLERLKEARSLFRDKVWESETTLERKFKQLADLVSNGDLAGGLSFLETINAAPTAEMGQRLAALEAMFGLPERALDRLLAMPADELTAASKGLLVRLLLQLERREDAHAWLRRLIEEDPDSPSLVMQLCNLQVSGDQILAAADTLSEGLRRWPDDWQILKQVWWQPMPWGRYRQLFETAAAARQSRPLSGLASWHFALVALGAGQTELACEELCNLAPQQKKSSAGELLAALHSRPLASWTEKARFNGWGTDLFECVRVPDAQATLIVFPGLDGRCHSLPFEFLDSLLASHPVNVIYVRDPMRLVLRDGITNFGDGREHIPAKLQELVYQLAAPRLVTMGFSAGGFTAMRCAALLDADAAVSFSGPTFLASRDDGNFRSPYLTFSHLLSHFSERQRDVLPDVEARPDLRVLQILGARHVMDMRQAARLDHLPNVVTEPCEEALGHAALLSVITNGRFDAIVSRACGNT